MKTIKYILWFIIIATLGILIYQNLEYFMTTVSLKFDLKVASWNWTIPELQNIAYFGICFLLGLIIAGIKGFAVKLRLKKQIKSKDADIALLNEQVHKLKADLGVFQHDPYIKKEMKEKTVVDPPENDNKKGDKSGTAD
ncbi:DUF1049 domain-containing protein [Desulfobacula toluolica]|uniref:Conserved uncharacterized protein n=1 Tax=Desulfobacula toluolica (strain DSM 7467 / Tol2) TaxID=651182 RepID=K0NGG7_DESTT|nr:DUF1049 domain-containing protein [Desulfobacula toluolica]CCK80005.1 conserved uncharacterized protein [Desulfobacula toluolica Tol2]